MDRGPARAQKARLGDPRDGDIVVLVAALHVEMRVILTERGTDIATGPLFENQHRTNDRLHPLPEQQPVAGLIGIGAPCAEKWRRGKSHADAGFTEIAEPRVLSGVAQGAAITFQPVHQPAAVARLNAAQCGFRLCDPR